jgi:hypothetical protein
VVVGGVGFLLWDRGRVALRWSKETDEAEWRANGGALPMHPISVTV